MPKLIDDWQAPASGQPDSYNLYNYDSSTGDETLVANVPGNVTHYEQNGVAPGTYDHYVSAVKDGVQSVVSNETLTTVLAPPPATSESPIYSHVLPYSLVLDNVPGLA